MNAPLDDAPRSNDRSPQPARVRALIVDANEELAENLTDILRVDMDDRIDCRSVHTLRDAIDAIEADLDVVLVDLYLPDGDGAELLEPLRMRAPFAQVVVITGDATVERAVSAMERGALGYILKPFKAAHLLETVHRAIAHARLLREHEQLRIDLERSEARHRAVIESAPVLVLALDPADRIVIWNRRLEAATGLSFDQMRGKPGRDFVGEGRTDRRLTTASGEHRLVRWQLAEVPAIGDEVPVTFAVGIDVTEEREASRRAMRAERLAAVGTLAAGLAHEVRNPLNSASLQLQVLERRLARNETRPEALSSVVQLVHGEIRRLDHLVNDFLAFARPSPMDLKSTQINDIVRGVYELMLPECAVAKVDFVAEVDPRVGVVQGDADRLRQVLLNVVRNAVEAIGSKGTVRLRTVHADEHGDISVVIEDDGPGFPEDAPIFDAFYTTKAQGTGLGLSIVHRIVSEHGGSIAVQSRPGRTSFTIRLPESGMAGSPSGSRAP